MSKFKLTCKVPSPTVVTYGRDDDLGYFCTVTREERTVAQYDRTSSDYDHLEGLLKVLISAGVLTATGIAEAYDLLPVVGHPCDLPTEQGQLAAVLLENLRVGD